MRVDKELDYKGITRTFLSDACGFSLTNIGQGIKSGSSPSADTAVKIARVLGVSVEYLVEGDENLNRLQDENKLSSDIPELTRKFISLPENQRKIILTLIDELK